MSDYQPKFKKGEVVQLKSGGSKMTVSDHEAKECYLCVYFSNTGIQFVSLGEEVLIGV